MPARLSAHPRRRLVSRQIPAGDGGRARRPKAATAHSLGLDWAWPRAPSADSARKSARRAGSAGSNGGFCVVAYAPHAAPPRSGSMCGGPCWRGARPRPKSPCRRLPEAHGEHDRAQRRIMRSASCLRRRGPGGAECPPGVRRCAHKGPPFASSREIPSGPAAEPEGNYPVTAGELRVPGRKIVRSAAQWNDVIGPAGPRPQEMPPRGHGAEGRIKAPSAQPAGAVIMILPLRPGAMRGRPSCPPRPTRSKGGLSTPPPCRQSVRAGAARARGRERLPVVGGREAVDRVGAPQTVQAGDPAGPAICAHVEAPSSRGIQTKARTGTLSGVCQPRATGILRARAGPKKLWSRGIQTKARDTSNASSI